MEYEHTMKGWQKLATHSALNYGFPIGDILLSIGLNADEARML